MDKPKFNCYTKIKATPIPFLFTTSTQPNNVLKNGIKIKNTRISTSPNNGGRHTPKNNRSSTPLNKIYNTQIYHNFNQLPLVEAKSPLNRKLNFHSEIMIKSPLLNNSGSTIFFNKQKELQIIVALKKQIKQQNDIITKNAQEMEELKKMKNIAFVNEIKIENDAYVKEIDKMKKLIQAIDNSNSKEIEGKENEIKKALKDNNDFEMNTILLEKIKSYEKEISSLKTINESLNKQLAKKDKENKASILSIMNELHQSNKIVNELELKVAYLENINNVTLKRTLIPLLSNEEKKDIEYLLKQCLLSRSLHWSIISQIILEHSDLNQIAELITQHINLTPSDSWIIKRYLLDLSIDNNQLLPIESIKKILNDKYSLNLEEENRSDFDINLDTEISKIKDIIDKCKEIDIENKGFIEFNFFRTFYNIFFFNSSEMPCTTEFDLMIKIMKRNMSVPFNQLDYNALYQTYIPQNDNNNDNENIIDDLMIETQELIIEDDHNQIIQKEIYDCKENLCKSSNKTISHKKKKLNQNELIEALKIYFNAKHISFEAFVLPLESKIIINNDIKCIQIGDFIEYLKGNQIINEQYSITFEESYLLGNPPQINISKLSILFLLNDNNSDYYHIIEKDDNLQSQIDIDKTKSITFKGNNPQCESLIIEDEPIRKKSLNVSAKIMVDDIFQSVLHQQYMINQDIESKAIKLVDEVFIKVKKNYLSYLLNPDVIEINDNIIEKSNEINNQRNDQVNDNDDNEFALDRLENKVNNSNDYTFAQKPEKREEIAYSILNEKNLEVIEHKPNEPKITEETYYNNTDNHLKKSLVHQKSESNKLAENENSIKIEDI